MFASRIILLTFSVFALCSCVRTSDGTVEPKYEMTVARRGWLPRVDIHRRAVTPSPARVFEEEPLAEPAQKQDAISVTAASDHRSRSRPTAVRTGPIAKAEHREQKQPGHLSCRQEATENGRYRVVCF